MVGGRCFQRSQNIYIIRRQLVLALGVEQNQLKSIRNKIQEVNWQRKQEQVRHHYDIIYIAEFLFCDIFQYTNNTTFLN